MKIGDKVTSKKINALQCLKFENVNKILVLDFNNTILIFKKQEKHITVIGTMQFKKAKDSLQAFKMFVNEEFNKMSSL